MHSQQNPLKCFSKSLQHPIKIDQTFTHNIISSHSQLLVCEYFQLLIENEEKRIQLRQQLLNIESFNPINIIQRIDRSQSGYVSHQDLIQFLKENNIVTLNEKSLKLIFPKVKTPFNQFVKLFLNRMDHEQSLFFNQRCTQNETVIRQFDRLDYKLEHETASFINYLVQMAIQEEVMKSVITEQQKDFDLMRLFKIIKFSQNSEGITSQDLKRLFIVNNIAIDDDKLQSVFLGHLLNREELLFQDFCQLFTKRGQKTIVYGALKDNTNSSLNKVQEVASKSVMQEYSQKSKSKKPTLFKVTAKDILNEQRSLSSTFNPNSQKSKTHYKNSLSMISNQQDFMMKTMSYKTDYISEEKILKNFVNFIKEQILLDDDFEDIKIRLVNDRDFYPQMAFKNYLGQNLEDTVSASQILDFVNDQSINIDEVYQTLENLTKSNISALNYPDFLKLITPLNQDFAKLFDERVQKELNPEFRIHQTSLRSNIQQKMQNFFRNLVVNQLKNLEIRRTYDRECKQQGLKVLRYISQEGTTQDPKFVEFISYLRSKNVEINQKQLAYLRERYEGPNHKISHEKFEEQLRI
eukprot:403332333